MRHSLVPLACEQRHPACFFAGLRLVGIDGGQWNLLNTVQINAQVPKSRSRRAQAAFAKLSMSTLVEPRHPCTAGRIDVTGCAQ
ncbi:MAG: hypothetical protein IPK32_11970 [Verrucomicrobiaceae bacterium]|nr:hypothetical protein [Verrucomicrobiaceae bacterium]MBK8092667.1 hypothetical protein [Verrucomicrobiaceae bacterium]